MAGQRAKSLPGDMMQAVEPKPGAPKPGAKGPRLADESHVSRTSPAQMLQMRVEMAMNEPVVDRWSAPVRLGVLLGLTVGSWAAIIGVARLVLAH
jgi:hypothetical protein